MAGTDDLLVEGACIGILKDGGVDEVLEAGRRILLHLGGGVEQVDHAQEGSYYIKTALLLASNQLNVLAEKLLKCIDDPVNARKDNHTLTLGELSENV